MPKLDKQKVTGVRSRAMQAMKDAISGKPIEEGVRAVIGQKIFEVLSKDVPEALKKGLTVEQKIEKLHNDKVFMKLARAAGLTDGDISGSVKGIADDYYARKEKVDDAGKVGKVGRNEPCPCGSGKKYKRCCGM